MSDDEKRRFKVADNAGGDERAPYVLIDEGTDEVIRVGVSPRSLADHAFDHLGADSVRHEETFIYADFGRS